MQLLSVAPGRYAYRIPRFISRSRFTRSSRGGWVENRFSIFAPAPLNGFTMKRWAVAGPPYS